MFFLMRGGKVGRLPTFGVNSFMKLLEDIFPQHERRGGGVFKNSVVSLFPGKPKDKSRGKIPELIEDVTFKGTVHPVFESFRDITFYSVGTSEIPSHKVP